MNKFLSPEELWQKFDISGPLLEEVLQTDVFGDFVYEQVMFSGQKYDDGVCKIFGVLAYSASAPKPMPCIMLVHDFGGRVDYSYIDYFLNLGVAVFMCDYSGARDGERHTIFPPSKSHMNYCENNASDITRGIENSVWIGDTLVFRHALKFLRSQPIIKVDKIGVVALGLGSIIGFHLAFCEPQLSFCCNFHYGGWRDFENILSQLDSEMAKYLLVVAPQVYSPLAKVPVFLLGSTNSAIGDSDKIFDTFARCNGLISNFLYLAPNRISTVDHLATKNLRLILNKYLADAHIEIPFAPVLEFTIEDSSILVSCSVEKEIAIKSVTLYYCQGDNPPHLRAFKPYKLVLASSGSYVGNIPLSSSLATVAMANVQFANGLTLSSNQIKIAPFGDTIKKHNTLSTGQRGTFFPLGTLNFPNANQFFSDKRQTVSSPCAFGLMGVCAPRIASFALSDPTLEKTNKTLLIQIYSDLPQKIRLLLSEGNSHDANFSTTIDLVGGELWQKVLLEPSDFANSQMASLENFEDCHLLFFNSEYDFYISSMIMV
ncbi:MAG: hypothetical protein R3Y32_04440 [Bacillota bacterium]